MLEIGYVKIYRSIINWEWYQDHNAKILFLHLILTANYEAKNWRGIPVKRGQRIVSYKKLSDELSLSIQNIRTALKRLISTNEITHEATSGYGLITIINYDKYQDATGELTINQQTTNNNERKLKKIINKEINNIDDSKESSRQEFSVNEEPNEANTLEKYTHDSKYYQAAKWFSEHAIENSPRKMRLPTEAVLQKWANIFRLMSEKDKIPWDELKATLKWTVTDGFWSTVILSAGSFREKYNQLAAKMKWEEEGGFNNGNDTRSDEQSNEVAARPIYGTIIT